MQPTRLINPQLGPVLALTALLTEHQLPPITWSITDHGTLRGDITGSNSRPVLAMYTAVLGGDADPLLRYTFRGAARVGETVHAVWQDIRVTIIATSDASAYPELAAPQAVAA
ncbi:hypothetical protein [Kitasatospora sp. McL0602]|uniref:hypothetical protein n=1 Tax=Kitasatospora sp. McL0602 TaxID=3439530 RepID=UPI003F8CC26C